MTTTVQTQGPDTWDDHDFSSKVDQEHQRLLTGARRNGITDGLNEKPSVTDSLGIFTSFVTDGYNSLVAELQKRTSPAMLKILGAEEIKAREESDVQDKKEMAEIRATINEPKPQSESSLLWKPLLQLICGLIGLILIVAGDWRYLASSLEAISGGGNLSASFIALAISISVAVTVHAMILLTPRIKRLLWRRFTRFGSLVFFLVLFYSLAYIRVYHFGYEGDNTTLFITSFVVFNFLMVFALWFVATKFIVPGFSALGEAWKHKKKIQKIDRLQTEINALDARIKLREKELRASLTDKIKIREYAKNMERKIQAYYRITWSEYLRSNMENRKGPTPMCFNSQPPELQRIEYNFVQDNSESGYESDHT